MADLSWIAPAVTGTAALIAASVAVYVGGPRRKRLLDEETIVANAHRLGHNTRAVELRLHRRTHSYLATSARRWRFVVTAVALGVSVAAQSITNFVAPPNSPRTGVVEAGLAAELVGATAGLVGAFGMLAWLLERVRSMRSMNLSAPRGARAGHAVPVPRPRQPPPVALASTVDRIDPPEITEPRFEAKWDGFRGLLVAGGGLWSRHGKELTAYFPDIVPALARALPAGAVVDGEIVVWNPMLRRLDFDALSRRLVGGQRAVYREARDMPAHFVAFDLLSDGEHDLRGRPLDERRQKLEEMLLGVGGPVALCQQTRDVDEARTWMTDNAAAGLEGLVIKGGGDPYPTTPGKRVWRKLKIRGSLDLVAIAVSKASSPVLLLALPEEPATPVAATVPLSKTHARQLRGVAISTGRTRHQRRPFDDDDAEPTTFGLIEPVSVEVEADVAMLGGTIRHPVRVLRIRSDLM